MVVIPVKGTIVSSGNRWIYDWFGIQAVAPCDIEKALNKANGDDVVVEINSGGGEVFAGFEIYTLIKQYVGNLEIHIVGLAGSAASVIAMAGECKISPVGMIMIHNSSTYSEGDYREMDASSDMLKTINSSIRLAYLGKSKVDENELINLMDKETWMNAKQAVECGFADSILFEEKDAPEDVYFPVASVKDVVLSPKTINKMKSLKAKDKLNETNADIIFDENENLDFKNSIAIESANAVHIEDKKEGGECMNYQEIRNKHPEIANEIEGMISEAEKRGAKNERERLKAIDDIAGNIDSKLVNDAKYGENPVTAEQLALQAIKNNSMLGKAYLNNAIADSNDSGVDDVKTQPTDSVDDNSDDQLAEIAANAANRKRKVI